MTSHPQQNQPNPNLTAIYEWIVARTPESARVIDIGCGDGTLLALLAERKRTRGSGIELSQELVHQAILRGLSVYHGNVDEGLVAYGDNSFDLAILSLTIQELSDPLHVIEEALRVGRRAVVVFPNFANWRSRWQLAVHGQAPDTPSLPHKWFDSPNRHYLSVLDWEDFVCQARWRIVEKGFVAAGREVITWPNLFSELAMYLIEKED